MEACWEDLIKRYGRSVIQSIWADPAMLIWGEYENAGNFHWQDAAPVPLPHWGWFGAIQRHEDPRMPWIAVDWDNGSGSETVARTISRHVAALRRVSARAGTATLNWGSKSGHVSPQSGNQHVFFYLPELTPPERERHILQLLGDVLERPLVQGRFDSGLAREGLDPRGYFLFPAPGVTNIRIGLTSAGDLDAFAAAWRTVFLA